MYEAQKKTVEQKEANDFVMKCCDLQIADSNQAVVNECDYLLVGVHHKHVRMTFTLDQQ